MTMPTPTSPSPPITLAELIAKIDDIIGTSYYGSVLIKFQNGQPTICEKLQIFKLDGNNPRKEPR